MASKIGKGEFVCYSIVLSFLIVMFIFFMVNNLKNPRAALRYSYEMNYPVYSAVLFGVIIFLLVIGLTLLIRQRINSIGE